jgi:hypothetical protein
MTKISFRELDPRILPDMSARVAFLTRELQPNERTARIAVPQAAVMQRDGRAIVFVVNEERLREVPVQTGAKIGELVEVSGAVQTGDKVVIRPAAELRDGQTVRIAAK